MSVSLQGGHTECALCVAVNADGRIISGGESGKLCIWSPDGSLVQQTCLPEEDCSVTSVVCVGSHKLYVAGGQFVYCYDTRNLSAPSEPLLAPCDDEINQIAVDSTHSRLAVADDSGVVTVIAVRDASDDDDTSGVSIERTLRAHTNICSTVAFCANRPGELVSAGYDGMLLQWVRSRCVCRVAVRDFGVAAGSAPPITPPFVHSVAVTPHWLAAGTENALIEVFSARRRVVEHRCTLASGHTCGVSHVHFPEEHVLLSGGNDGLVLLWDLNALGSHAPRLNGTRHTPVAEITPQWRVSHGAKVNWIASGEHAQQRFFVVADNTPNLTVYTYPQ